MNLQEILNYINYVCNKEQVGNTLSPVQYNTLLEVVNIKLFYKYLGVTEEYLVNLPISKQMYEVSQRITEDIRQFKVLYDGINNPFKTVNSLGNMTLPDDYKYPCYLAYVVSSSSNCETTTSRIPVGILTDNQWVWRCNTVLMTPTLKNPVCNFQNSFVRFSPKTIQYVEFAYLREPIKPVYDYYINADGENIYLAPNTYHTLASGEEGSAGQTSGVVVSQTVEHEWNDGSSLQLAYMLLQEIGINLREQSLLQYSQMLKQQGK